MPQNVYYNPKEVPKRYSDTTNYGAVTLVQSPGNNGSNNTGATATWSSATTVGNFLYAVLSVSNSTAVTTPSGWTLVTTLQNATSGGYQRTYRIENSASRSGTETFAWVTTTMGWCLTLMEFSGVATTSAQDQAATTSSTGADPFTLTTASSTSQPATLEILSFNHNVDVSVGSITSGYTLIDNRYQATNATEQWVYYRTNDDIIGTRTVARAKFCIKLMYKYNFGYTPRRRYEPRSRISDGPQPARIQLAGGGKDR